MAIVPRRFALSGFRTLDTGLRRHRSTALNLKHSEDRERVDRRGVDMSLIHLELVWREDFVQKKTSIPSILHSGPVVLKAFMCFCQAKSSLWPGLFSLVVSTRRAVSCERRYNILLAGYSRSQPHCLEVCFESVQWKTLRKNTGDCHCCHRSRSHPCSVAWSHLEVVGWHVHTHTNMNYTVWIMGADLHKHSYLWLAHKQEDT